jgi:hypothetical protein
MISRTYENIFDDYQAHIKRTAYKVRRHYNGGTCLSIGCGNGDVEMLLPFPVVCYDIHDAAKVLHPELDFRYEWPKEQFDLVIAMGCVYSYIPPSQQKSFIADLLRSTTDEGLVLMNGKGYIGANRDDIVIERIYNPQYPSHPKIKVI